MGFGAFLRLWGLQFGLVPIMLIVAGVALLLSALRTQSPHAGR